MILQPGPQTISKKIALFRGLFTGLEHVYGTFDPQTGRARQVKQPVTDEVIHAQPVDFHNEAKCLDLPVYIERSKSKGYHAWLFFEERGVSATKARRVVHDLLARIGMHPIEVFPKQDRLATRIKYGNFINAPLFGGLIPRGRMVFIQPHHPHQPIPKQWDFLAAVTRVTETALDAIIRSRTLSDATPDKTNTPSKPSPHPRTPGFSLPACARRMLAEGVSSYQRVACFRLAVSLKRAGLPCDIALAALKAWAGKNRPADDKSIITEPEILSQTASAYTRNYRGLGCEDPAINKFCDPHCPVRKKMISIKAVVDE